MPVTIEHIDLNAARVVNDICATSYWRDSLYQRCFDCLWKECLYSTIVPDLNAHAWLNPDKVATTYLSNHDHSHVTWQVGANDNQGSMKWYRTQPDAIALLTTPGTPMIQNGQEFAEDHWLPQDDKGTGRRVKSRPLRWGFLEDSIGSALFAVYSKLIALRNSMQACEATISIQATENSGKRSSTPRATASISGGRSSFSIGGGMTTAFSSVSICVINFSQEDQMVDVPFPADGQWKDLLNEDIAPLPISGYWLRNWQVKSNWEMYSIRKDKLRVVERMPRNAYSYAPTGHGTTTDQMNETIVRPGNTAKTAIFVAKHDGLFSGSLLQWI